MKDNSRPVYSCLAGRLCPDCGEAIAACTCRKSRPATDGIVRVRRESKGRGGKTVTVVTGLSLDEEPLKKLAADLKRTCGTGGTAKDWNIEIQGDHLETVVAALRKRGYTVKKSGG